VAFLATRSQQAEEHRQEAGSALELQQTQHQLLAVVCLAEEVPQVQRLVLLQRQHHPQAVEGCLEARVQQQEASRSQQAYLEQQQPGQDGALVRKRMKILQHPAPNQPQAPLVLLRQVQLQRVAYSALLLHLQLHQAVFLALLQLHLGECLGLLHLLLLQVDLQHQLLRSQFRHSALHPQPLHRHHHRVEPLQAASLVQHLAISKSHPYSVDLRLQLLLRPRHSPQQQHHLACSEEARKRPQHPTYLVVRTRRVPLPRETCSAT
jgi:hypothetical protein